MKGAEVDFSNSNISHAADRPVWIMMMMIAFITFNSSLVPLIEGLCM